MTTSTGENTHDDAACVELFTDTLARLNEIHEAQMQSIIDIAIAAADAANSIAPSNNTGDFVERVTALVNELKEKSDELEGQMGTGGRPADEHTGEGAGDAFCETVESDLNTAFQNSLAAQQQLYTMGASVLAEGASLILNAHKGDDE